MAKISSLFSNVSSATTKHLRNVGLIALAGVGFSLLMHGGSSRFDPSGYAMVMMGLFLVGSMFSCCFGALGYVFKRTILGDLFGGFCLFITIFGATTLLLH